MLTDTWFEIWSVFVCGLFTINLSNWRFVFSNLLLFLLLWLLFFFVWFTKNTVTNLIPGTNGTMSLSNQLNAYNTKCYLYIYKSIYICVRKICQLKSRNWAANVLWKRWNIWLKYLVVVVLVCLNLTREKNKKEPVDNTHTNLFSKVIGTITFGFQMHWIEFSVLIVSLTLIFPFLFENSLKLVWTRKTTLFKVKSIAFCSVFSSLIKYICEYVNGVTIILGPLVHCWKKNRSASTLIFSSLNDRLRLISIIALPSDRSLQTVRFY